MNLGYFCIRKVASYHNERRCHVVEIKVFQVRYVLASSEHTERSLKVNSREQYKRYFRTLHHIPEPKTRKNVVKPKCSEVTNRNASSSEENPTNGKIST